MLKADEIEAMRVASEQLLDPVITYLITDIARRVSEAAQLTSTAQYQIWRAQQLGLSQYEIKKRVAKLLKLSQYEVERLFRQSAETGYRFDLNRIGTTRAIPFSENPEIQQIVSSAVRMAKEELRNITQTMGMVMENGEILPITDAYLRASDLAFIQTITGATDYNTAVRNALKGLRSKGLQWIDYESGAHCSVETAIRRNVFSAAGIMQEQISKNVHDSTGCNGWEISAHAASAPDHEPIQGKQYSDEAYERLNKSLVRRIGTLNCGHAAFPIILGVSQPQHSEEQLEQLRKENEEGFEYEGKHYTRYEATQRQRKLERSIRKNRENILLNETLGDEEQLQADQIREVRLEDEYKRFSEKAGLRLQRERMEMAGYGPKQARAAEKADKENQILLENQRRYDTMVRDLKGNKLVPQNAAVHIPPRTVDANTFSFDDKHINEERNHNVTKEQAVQWVEGARISVTVWKGRFEKYYGNEGAAFLDMEKSEIRTAFSTEQFDDTLKRILEVLTKYGY